MTTWVGRVIIILMGHHSHLTMDDYYLFAPPVETRLHVPSTSTFLWAVPKSFDHFDVTFKQHLGTVLNSFFLYRTKNGDVDDKCKRSLTWSLWCDLKSFCTTDRATNDDASSSAFIIWFTPQGLRIFYGSNTKIAKKNYKKAKTYTKKFKRVARHSHVGSKR